MNELFFKLLRLGLGTEKYNDFPTLSENEWENICSTAKKQTMTGILMLGIEFLPKEKQPGLNIKKELMRICLTVERINLKLNLKAVQVTDFFVEKGFSPILLKGQGVATLYEKPGMRMPGDIDIWLSDGRKAVTRFVKELRPEAEILYHHIHLTEKDGLEVEVHTVPSLLYNPFANRKLQKWFEKWKEQAIDVELSEGTGKVKVPCDEMNRVYMLIHKYRHLFCEGIGLRQMTDYMMLLRKGFSENERIKTVKILKELNLITFCKAVMYVLTEILGMEKAFLLTEPDERAGKLLIEEIMRAGNFGKEDKRIDHSIKGDSLMSFWTRNKRNLKFIRDYPNEVLWGPYFKIYNWFWRKFTIVKMFI